MSDLNAGGQSHPQVAGWALGALDPAEAAEFPAHLRSCEPCRSELERLKPAVGLLGSAAPAVELPANLLARTLAAVEHTAVKSRRRRRRVRLLSFAAGLVVLLVAAGVTLVRTDPSPAESFQVSLAAPAGVGSGEAVAERTPHGWSIHLSVRGLTNLGQQGSYECWYVGPGDTPDHPNRVTAGTFRVDPDGQADVRMWAAVDPKKFPIMQVTAEPANGDPASSGRVVLAGRIQR